MNKAIALLIFTLALGGTASRAGDDGEHKKCGQEATICVREMVTSLRQRGWIGIEWDEAERPPKISHVVKGSPAEAARVQVGDVVMAFNGVSTSEAEEVMWAEMKRSLVPGKVITLSVVRDGAALKLDVTLIAVPEHIIAQWVGKHVMAHHVAAADREVGGSP